MFPMINFALEIITITFELFLIAPLAPVVILVVSPVVTIPLVASGTIVPSVVVANDTVVAVVVHFALCL